jgi:uracil-DNA glycosylase
MADFNWEDFLKEELSKDYMVRTINKVKEDSEKYNIFPPEDMVFASYNITPFDKVKVVILGQTHITGKVKLWDCLFQFKRELKFPHHYETFIKKLRMIWAFKSQTAVI